MIIISYIECMKTRICSICKNELPETPEYFASRKDRKNTLFQGICRSCQKEYRKEHYNKNKQKYISRAQEYTQKTVQWFQEIKKDLKCEVCNEQRWWILEFHHKDPGSKEGNISEMIRNGGRKRILEEIKKCKVLCANCHRDLHHQEKQAVYA